MTPLFSDARRDAPKILQFWQRIDGLLEWYARHSAVRLCHLVNREGFYLLFACILLSGLTVGVSSRLRELWPWLPSIAGAVAAYYVADSFFVNTSVVFVTRRPIHLLRSILLTLVNFANVGVAFALFYALERCAFKEAAGGAGLTGIEPFYFSLITQLTIGYGDIVPNGDCAWVGQATVLVHLGLGLYFLAAILTSVVAWAQAAGSK